MADQGIDALVPMYSNQIGSTDLSNRVLIHDPYTLNLKSVPQRGILLYLTVSIVTYLLDKSSYLHRPLSFA